MSSKSQLSHSLNCLPRRIQTIKNWKINREDFHRKKMKQLDQREREKYVMIASCQVSFQPSAATIFWQSPYS